MDIEEAISRFLTFKKSYCADKSVVFYDEGLEYFANWLKGKELAKVEDLTTDVITEYQVSLREKKSRNRTGKLKNGSVNTYMRSVRVFVKWLYDEELIEKQLRLPRRIREDNDQIFVLTRDEVLDMDRAIFESINTPLLDDDLRVILYLRNYLIVHMMLDEGLRIGEVVNLKRSDIDLEKRILYVNKGKGRKDRILPIAEKIFIRLDQLLDNYREMKMEDENLFYCFKLDRILTMNTVKQYFAKLREKSGLKRLHPHILRHTFATSFIMSGGDVSVLKVLLGHSDIKVTQKYLHLATQYTITKLDIYPLDVIFFPQRLDTLTT